LRPGWRAASLRGAARLRRWIDLSTGAGRDKNLGDWSPNACHRAVVRKSVKKEPSMAFFLVVEPAPQGLQLIVPVLDALF
jgi:hypothetical protein